MHLNSHLSYFTAYDSSRTCLILPTDLHSTAACLVIYGKAIRVDQQAVSAAMQGSSNAISKYLKTQDYFSCSQLMLELTTAHIIVRSFVCVYSSLKRWVLLLPLLVPLLWGSLLRLYVLNAYESIFVKVFFNLHFNWLQLY